MKQYNYVYKISNLVNGKIYIGKHSTDNLDDNYMGSGHRLHLAYAKYGLENFKKEVIDYYTSEVELNQGEIYWIAKFNSTNPEIGYNLTYGGDGVIPTEEVKRKISEALKGRQLSEEHKQNLKGKPSPKKGSHLTEEHKQKISEVNRGENNGMYNKRHSEESKQKISEAKKGKESWNKGKHWSVETRRKISEAKKGKSNGWIGKCHTEESKQKMSEAAKGRIPWNKGLKLKKESQI